VDDGVHRVVAERALRGRWAWGPTSHSTTRPVARASGPTLVGALSSDGSPGLLIHKLAWATGRVVPWRGFHAGAPGTWWGRAWGCAAFMLAYFDDNGHINHHSGVVGLLWGCGSGFMLVYIDDNNCISIRRIVFTILYASIYASYEHDVHTLTN
jgi:anaerobic selenocysteine-containing dehydrogenase